MGCGIWDMQYGIWDLGYAIWYIVMGYGMWYMVYDRFRDSVCQPPHEKLPWD
jgi:hypothetical protein